jgi:hypothetical protein
VGDRPTAGVFAPVLGGSKALAGVGAIVGGVRLPAYRVDRMVGLTLQAARDINIVWSSAARCGPSAGSTPGDRSPTAPRTGDDATGRDCKQTV